MQYLMWASGIKRMDETGCGAFPAITPPGENGPDLLNPEAVGAVIVEKPKGSGG